MQVVEFLESNKRTGDFIKCDLILSFTIIGINNILLFTCFKNQSEFRCCIYSSFLSKWGNPSTLVYQIEVQALLINMQVGKFHENNKRAGNFINVILLYYYSQLSLLSLLTIFHYSYVFKNHSEFCCCIYSS